jgi:hypothetical protein
MLNRRNLAASGAFAATAFAFARTAGAAPSDEASVGTAVEAYRIALLSSDKSKLEAICSNNLSYGHSSGKVQDKTVFVTEAAKSKWNSISFSDETNHAAGDNAISRFVFTGENETGGKTNAVKIGILIVWVAQGSDWKMLARQGYKI